MKFLWHLYDMMYMYTCVCVQFYKKIRCAYVRVSVYLNIFLKNLKVGNDPNNIVSIHACLQLYLYNSNNNRIAHIFHQISLKSSFST